MSNCKSEVLVDNDKNCQTATAKLSSLKVATYHFQWAGGGGGRGGGGGSKVFTLFTVHSQSTVLRSND